MNHYGITFKDYGILLFHPVTTNKEGLYEASKQMVNALVKSNENFIVILPNNDSGTEIIQNEYKRLKANKKIKIFPSIRFEYFLRLLKESDFIIGNSSAGVREAPFYGIPTINLGDRQNNRADGDSIFNVDLS